MVSNASTSGAAAMNIDDDQATLLFANYSIPASFDPEDSSILGKFSELPATKAMKTFCRNRVVKRKRLQERLLFYSSLVEGEGDNYRLKEGPEVLKKIKQLYEFKFVGIHQMLTTSVAVMDASIGLAAVKLLIKDVNDDLAACQTDVAAAPLTLLQELSHFHQAALGSSLFSEEEKKTYDVWWKKQIKHNIQKLQEFLIQLKAGAVTAVCDFIDWICQLFDDELTKFVLSGAPTKEGENPRNPESFEFEVVQKKKKPSQRRRQQRRKRQQKKQVGQGKDDQQEHPQGTGQTQRQAQNKVFVNVHTERNIAIPAYVFRTLNHGANYQLAQFPQNQQIWKEWEQTKKFITEKARREKGQQGQRKSLDSSFVNIVAAVNDRRIYNNKYINKILRCDLGLRKAVSINNTLRDVFKFLTENDLLVILADKNLGLTIVDKDWYNIKMREHFDNTEAFEHITDWHNVVTGRSLTYMPYITQAEFALRTCVYSHLNRGAAGVFLEKYWKWSNCAVPQAYGLIKLHKEPKKLRYITPVVSWVNVEVAKYIVSYLQTYVDSIPWIVQSSQSLVPLLEFKKERSLWVGVFDVCDMYNQIDQLEAVAMLHWLAEEQGWLTDETADKWAFILDLIKWVYSTSYVSFKDDIFKQKRGLPMGSPLSPALANLTMAAFEWAMFCHCKAINQDVSYLTYHRFLDDILITAEYDVRANPDEFVHHGHHMATLLLSIISKEYAVESVINFDQTGQAWRQGECVEYLDLKITIGRDVEGFDKLKLSVFDKPTNLHIYTDPSTFFPLHYVYNWIQGENIRFIRNSSDIESYEAQLRRFKSFLFRRSYLKEKIEEQLSLNWYDDRSALLKGDKPHKDRKGKNLDNNRQNVHVLIENSGARNVITHAVKTVDNVNRAFTNSNLRFLPTIKRGKSILSSLNKLRKEKQ
jgi:hypothetical protein